jgi:hypothetical protein
MRSVEVWEKAWGLWLVLEWELWLELEWEL